MARTRRKFTCSGGLTSQIRFSSISDYIWRKCLIGEGGRFPGRNREAVHSLLKRTREKMNLF